MAKKCTLSTSKMPLEDLSRNSAVRIIDCPDMTSAFTVDVKNQIKQTKTANSNIFFISSFFIIYRKFQESN